MSNRIIKLENGEKSMNKAIIPIILLILIIAPTVYSQNLKVKVVSEDLEEVILQDSDTGEEWVARFGEMVEGWKIVKISHDRVTIVKQREGQTTLKTDLPVKASSRLLELIPQRD
jgi:hypothetical protein